MPFDHYTSIRTNSGVGFYYSEPCNIDCYRTLPIYLVVLYMENFKHKHNNNTDNNNTNVNKLVIELDCMGMYFEHKNNNNTDNNNTNISKFVIELACMGMYFEHKNNNNTDNNNTNVNKFVIELACNGMYWYHVCYFRDLAFTKLYHSYLHSNTSSVHIL